VFSCFSSVVEIRLTSLLVNNEWLELTYSLVVRKGCECVVVVTDFVKELKPYASEVLMELNVRTFFLLSCDVAH
jgi:hypothetical protein